MPTVAGEHAWRAVVAGADEHVGLESHNPRHTGVDFFGASHLRLEVAVLAGAVGVFEMNEEEIVLRPIRFEHGHLLVECLGIAEDVHAHEPRETLVHRIHGDRTGAQAVDFVVTGEAGLGGDTTERATIGFEFTRQKFLGLFDKLGGDLGRLFAVEIRGTWFEGRYANHLRIGIREITTEPRSTEHDHETMLLHGFDEDFDSRDRNLAKPDGERRGFFAGDAARAAIGNVAVGIDRAKVGADGDVAFLQLETNAGGFKRAAADEILQRIVSKQTQVTGTAAGTDAGLYGNAATENSLFRQSIEIGSLGGFEFRESAGMLRQTAESVGDEHNDFGVVFDVQLAGQFVHIHGGYFCQWLVVSCQLLSFPYPQHSDKGHQIQGNSLNRQGHQERKVEVLLVVKIFSRRTWRFRMVWDSRGHDDGGRWR